MRILFLFLLLVMPAHMLVSQTSPHGPISTPCAACHTTDSWTFRADASFDHSETGFPLTGQHRSTSCASCHQGLKFSGLASSCSSCHTDVHRAELGSDCQRCHTTKVWLVSDMIQRHQQTRFPLVGKHATAGCQDCHVPSRATQYAGTPVTCVGCHHNDFSSTTNPPHAASGFSSQCADCHRPNSSVWGTGFKHESTGFPLSGAHVAVACADCHKNNAFTGLPHDCQGCHQTQFAETRNPNHSAAKFPQQCEQCHSTTTWRPSSFSHENTSFPLLGAHRAVVCSDCHVNDVFAGLQTDCVPCHQSDFAGVLQPNHVSSQFPVQCLTCHSMNGWSGATFDHAATGFPLSGRHSTTACADCHTGGNYQLTYQGCFRCHEANFTQTQNPNHVALGFAQQCETCHSTVAWTPATFDHAATAFPLTGAHTSPTCVTCHANGNYQLTYQDCYQCHQTDFQAPTNPNHVSLVFSHRCETCHTTTAWQPSTFDHDQQFFRIYSGKHREKWQSCSQCHPSLGQYQDFTCLSCHEHSQSITDPRHSEVTGYVYASPNCYSCHRGV